MAKTSARNNRRKAMRIDVRRLEEMAEQTTVDAYDESEQICGWSCMLDDNVAVPFETTVLGTSVTVETVEQRGDTDRGDLQAWSVAPSDRHPRATAALAAARRFGVDRGIPPLAKELVSARSWQSYLPGSGLM